MDFALGTEAVRVETSFICTAMPALITGLHPFSVHPFFAAKLMPYMQEFYSVLNRFAAVSPEIMNLDNQYTRQKGGSEFLSCTFASTEHSGTTPRPLSLGSPTTDSSQRKRSVGIGGGCMDPSKAPPIYSLMKSLACLCGRFSGTLVVGHGDLQPYIADLMSSQPKYGKWLTSGIFEGGMEISCHEVLGRPLVSTPSSRRPRAPAQNTRHSGGIDVLAGEKVGQNFIPSSTQVITLIMTWICHLYVWQKSIN